MAKEYTPPPHHRLQNVQPHKPKLKSPKVKGDKFERELAAYLNDRLPLAAARAPLSGGSVSYDRTGSTPGPDLTGTPHLWIEAKRVERLNFPAALSQAQRGLAAASCPDIPIVINRRNRQTMDDAYVFLTLSDFIKLYRTYLAT